MPPWNQPRRPATPRPATRRPATRPTPHRQRTEPADGEPQTANQQTANQQTASQRNCHRPIPRRKPNRWSPAAETDSPTAEGDTDSPRETASEQAPAAPPIAEAIIRPKPDAAKINKCIKEWQVGSHRVRQLVHWLCDPFGDSDASGVPPAVLSMMPSLSTLQPGDQVVGVIVGVMPFGVFVELAPDCSGLIHVSKVSDGFVEDLHEAVQVGDVVTAWVTGVDQKRRRVALSAVSPEREAELQSQRGQREGHRHGGGRPPRGGQPARGGQQRGGQQSGGQPVGPLASSNQSRGRQGSGGQGGGRTGAGKPRGDRAGGGRSHDRRGGQRGQSRGPESYRVVSKEPAKPITEDMKKGAEPLRSFGDLMQFYTKDETPPAKEVKPKEKGAKTPPADPTVPAASDSGSGAPAADSAPPSPPTEISKPSADPGGVPQPPPASSNSQVADADHRPASDTSGGDVDSGETRNDPPAPSDAPSS